MRFAIIFLIIPVQAALWTIRFLNFGSLTSSLPAIVLACEHFLSLPLFFDNKRTSYMEKDSWKWTLVNRTKLRGYFEKVQMLFRSLLFFVVLQDILNLVARYFETKTDQMQMLCLLWFVTSYNIYFTSKIRSISWFDTRKKIPQSCTMMR